MQIRIPTDTEIASMPNVPPDVAGAYLGKRGQYIRCGLQYGRLPFGTAVKNRRWAYHIPGPALVRYKNYGLINDERSNA
jgi:hypothetical protein